MCPAPPRPAFCKVKRENVVYNGQKCPLSPQIWVSVYFALQCPTTRYLALLLPTSYHFAPHDRLLSAHVKRNHAHFSKYVVKIFLFEEGGFRRHWLWSYFNSATILGSPFILGSCFVCSEGGRSAGDTQFSASCRILSLFPLIAIRVDSPASGPIAQGDSMQKAFGFILLVQNAVAP